jgi:hypothetical protein
MTKSQADQADYNRRLSLGIKKGAFAPLIMLLDEPS